jgi:ferritin
MAMSATMIEAFNDQVTSELTASLAYLQMATYLDSAELPGMAHWMYQQSSEELAHGRRFMDFVVDRGGHIAIGDIAAPRRDFDGPAAVFAAALEHERKVSAQIRKLYELATAENDFESFPLLHAFLSEQVEEEATCETILSQLRRAADSEPALLLIDRELGARATPA